MNLLELFILAVGLSMDTFAAAVCKGLSMRKATLSNQIIVGLYFGGFQAVMPVIGYLVASLFADYIISFDHWIAFGLLAFIGVKMIIESFGKEDDNKKDEVSLKPAQMLPLALATSIDALAVGVSFAFLKVNIVPAVTFIGVVTFTISVIGVKIGNVFGTKFKSKAEFSGGVILILIGLKILLEHLGIL
ncbi:MAG: manganese efflux pump MntP family protein [Oscillospiraceae bacterium]|nr:manganese efflux pump MntP family protein [Oscillospiraceae bacterium]